ncbi:hypothetical protein [Chryseobacterium sediminis]|jgi:hypothetical protein|uniref:hypothetical protein n=1 Tax=Chryseobacterium sediminis TaxID=1679494 RepID=UPI00285535F7|nr:hypothetical protein [Chryseobacterium sediminis]MDR6461600.1 hypothetical protein [Chryseobacterium sediminis]
MKKYVVLVIGISFIFPIPLAKSQSILKEYKKFEISDTSSEIINAINLDLEQTTNKDFMALRNEEQIKYPLKSKNDVDNYISSFNRSLRNTKKEIEMQELMWKAENELRKYGLNVISNYALSMTSKHLSNFLVPAIQQGHELYIDHEFQKQLEKNNAKVDKIIVDLANILYTKGIDLTKANDEEAFNNLFALAYKRIPSLNRDDYVVFNKELTKRAYDFIKKNRDNIELLNVKVDSYRKSSKQLNMQITEFQKEITDEVTGQLSNVGKSIVELTKNQNEVFKTLDEIQQRIVINNNRIMELEYDMRSLNYSNNLLKVKQEEHSRLIAQNSFQIDILSGYTFQNLNTKQKIEGIDNGNFDNIFSDEQKLKLRKELEEIRTKETIISVASDIEQYSSAVYGGLVNSGILKGKDAERVGKFMGAVSILSGAARVYAGDVSGLTSIVSGIGNFSGKQKVSAEMQMLQRMMAVMNERFDRIDEHLVKIETKIDALSDTTLNMYKTMSLSFQFTFDQMDRIIWKADVLNKKATLLLYQDYQKCKEVVESWDQMKITLNSYSDYKKRYIQECEQCLKSLSNFPSNNAYFTVASNESLKDEKEIEFEIKDIYIPTKDLFYTFYTKDINKAVYSLMFPFNSTADTNKPFYYLSALDDLEVKDQSKVLDELLNYHMINEFTDFSIRFSNYFLIKGGNVDFQPLRIGDFIKDSNKKVNNYLVQKRFLKLLNITRSAIIQQSLLAGHLLLDPIYSSLFGYSTDKKSIELAIKVLNNNKLLATNFSTYLIRNNIKMGNSLQIKKMMDDAITDDNSLRDLNLLIEVNDIRFISDKVNRKLYITFQRNAQNINLPVADWLTIVENRMINTEGIYPLIETRQKISNKLIDLMLPKNFEEQSKEKFKYYFHAN